MTDNTRTDALPWTPTFAPDGRLALSLAISEYDHVRDLSDGLVRAQGIALNTLTFPVEEIFHRFTRYREWEVTELSMGNIPRWCPKATGPWRRSRSFHRACSGTPRSMCGAAVGVRAPADLRGKRVGLPEWAQTAAVYTRGMLVHEYGIGLDEIDWVQAGVDEPGVKRRWR